MHEAQASYPKDLDPLSLSLSPLQNPRCRATTSVSVLVFLDYTKLVTPLVFLDYTLQYTINLQAQTTRHVVGQW